VRRTAILASRAPPQRHLAKAPRGVSSPRTWNEAACVAGSEGSSLSPSSWGSATASTAVDVANTALSTASVAKRAASSRHDAICETMPVTNALPIKNARFVSLTPSSRVNPRGKPLRASNSSGVNRRSRPSGARTTCVVRDAVAPPSLVMTVRDGLSSESGNAIAPSLYS